MTKKIIVAALIMLIVYLSSSFIQNPKQVNAQVIPPKEILASSQPVKTTSRFETKLVTDVKILTRDTVYKDDPDTEIGTDTVLEEGSDGKKTTLTKVYYYEGQEYTRDIISTDIVPAVDKTISRGTKIVWRTLVTADGPISYWRKLHVWATQYDSHCLGCNNTTAIGLQQGKGVIAVDPLVIKLGSKLYIPGYGPAVAGDVGGSVKGMMIDVGFPDAQTSGWYSHFVDIYLQ